MNLRARSASPWTRPLCHSRFYSSQGHARPYTFHIGASFIGKPDWGDDPRGIPPAMTIPFRDKMLSWKREIPSVSAGHDFFYVQEGLSIGVADGVGGWGDILDPSLFSQALMYYAARCASSGWPGEPERDPTLDEHLDEALGTETPPVTCMERAYKSVMEDDGLLGDAPTLFCLVASLGDSGFYIIRGQTVLYKTPVQTHYFNCPRQLSKLPKGYPLHSRLQDTPQDAVQYATRLHHGDIIIAYTDGLSDNVFDGETLGYTLSIMRRPNTDTEKAQYLADFLVLHARRCMYDFGRVSPFEIEWAEHRKEKRVNRGGKIDECVINWLKVS
ncbi:uncharacterized protein EI90DRAFT_3041670 [Cantharellus anzutake]|uniref:uncharacterized protein n=1 Tax=Cantharellus anzutake TaxID=1750568 RepID=UPI0019062CAD|nr:uncharacterized protein EI90DRAFT_3041670 [Cantharellus anzutake]KAF8338110.1 hypothetical protein EI90DRAFT_3041670 [Cantharellus anzutake]